MIVGKGSLGLWTAVLRDRGRSGVTDSQKLRCPSFERRGRDANGKTVDAPDTRRDEIEARPWRTVRARSVASIRSILKNGLDRAFFEERPEDRPLRHANIRGQGYYHLLLVM